MATVQAIQIEQGTQSVRPENPVDLSGVEAKGVELTLQIGDVVTADHRHSVIEQAIPKPVPGIDEDTPGVGSDNPVAGKALGALEVADCGGGGGPKDGCTVGSALEAERGKPALDIPDRLALVTFTIEPHGPIVA